MRRLAAVSIFAVFLSLGLVLASGNTAYADSCVTAKCHSGMGKAKFVHGPVAVGQCTICHTAGKSGHPTHSKKSDFKFPAEGKALCYLCHETKETGKVVHGPIKKGECIACHDPHQSNSEKQLKKKTMSALCFSCHENNKTDKKFVHGPVAAGDCNICHNPHSSDYKNLLELQGSDLCFLCHLDRKAQFELKYKHKPAAEDCSNCHDPHSTDFRYQLKAEGQDLCFRCHKDMEKYIRDSTVKHGALKEKKCTVCHTPHASDYPRQLKASAKQICYTCHKEMGKKVREAKYVHGPVRQDDCYACHNPHGSDFTKILKKPFPAEFYLPYSTKSYALCFDCHNKDIALDRFTTTLTGFRNGDKNLHFVHVNREKGRSCKACHEVHAGDQPKHIRREVPFGKMWMLPIKYTQTKNGGSCEVGCHKPKGYDRINPVVN